MVTIKTEITIDEKGRILLPLELRNALHFSSGDKLCFQLREDGIILQKSVSTPDLLEHAEKFAAEIKKTQKAPIKFEKVLQE